ncbi:membrane-associated protein, putative, partial [Bodo saltans]
MSLEKVARKKISFSREGKRNAHRSRLILLNINFPFFIPFLMLTALFVFPENRAGHKHRGGRGGGSTHSPALYTIGIETPSAVAASFPSTSSNKDAVTSPPRGSISVSITDATDQRARKDAVCDMIASSREDLCRSIIAPLVTSIVPPAPGLPREYHPTRSYAQQPQYAQGTVVLDGSSKSRNHILFDPYDGLLVTAIRDLATKETTKAVFLSAVELDEHNQLIDLLSAEARAQRSASPGVALRAGVVRHQIPTVVEDTTDRFTAIEETTFEDVSKDCHVTLQYLASKCQGDTRHQVISVVVVHRQQRSTDATIDGDNGSAAVGATPNTTLQFVSLVVNEITRGTRATRHCVQNVASLLESRSNAVSFTSTKVLFLLKPVLTGKQPGAWITLLDPHGAATSVVTTTSAAIDAVPPTSESFKDAFSVLQTLSRVSGAARNGNAECLLWNHSSSSFPPRSLVGNANEQLHISTSSSTGTGAAMDTTLRRASRLTEEIDKRFQQLSGAVPPSSASHGRAVNQHVDSHQQVPQQQHHQRERSSSISSSDLEPRQQHPTPVVVTMSRNGAAQQQQQLRQSRSHHTTPIHQRFAVDDDDDSSRRRRAHTPQQTTTTRHVKDMQRRIRYLEQSESHDGSHRRGGPTQIIQNLGDDDDFYDNQGGGYRAQPSSSQRNKTNNNSKSQDHFITRGKATQSPHRTTKAVKDVSDNDNDVNNNNGDGEYRSSSPLVQRLKKELAKEKSHSSSMLHNYETYKHTMEGVLLRLRKDLEGQSIKLEDTQKQLRLRDKILRNGNDGHQVKTRELESVTTKLKQLEELHHSSAADHQQQKSAWKAQRVELHKSNDQLQHRVNDLLETIN